MSEILKIENLEKSFGSLSVLRDINLTVNQDEAVTVIGASESGKSTMLRCINLFEEPDGGHIYFEGVNLTDLNTSINRLREDIGMIFQSFNLFNNLSVLDSCTLALPW
ncbi:MAG: ATP-binding cassette domain-containing protein [Solobacterium sp.]|nr:ATP-binding cassette domain-containing protein [Solobacterium sp.]